MFLERWWLRIRLAPWRIAQRENHNWNVMRRTFATAHENPSDGEEAQKNEQDKEVITMILNQTIQNLGDTRNDFYRVFHFNLSGTILLFVAHSWIAFIMLRRNMFQSAPGAISLQHNPMILE